MYAGPIHKGVIFLSVSDSDVILRRSEGAPRDRASSASPLQSRRLFTLHDPMRSPSNLIRTARSREVPHAGFAAIQDDSDFKVTTLKAAISNRRAVGICLP